FFPGPVQMEQNNNHLVKLYAPATFDPGSSVYHLDEVQYSPPYADSVHALMTPFISKGEAIHNPGTVTMGMMADWGWIHTFIDHKPLIDREDLSTPVLIEAEISSDTEFYPDSTYLVYSYDEFETDDTLVFSPVVKGDQFEVIIPVDIPARTISYYISTQDDYGRIYTDPSGGPDFYHQFYVGPDTVKPEIEHFPIDFMLYNNDSLKIKAAVTDNIGVDSVYVEYLLNDITQDPLRMNYDSLDDYSTYIIVELGVLNPGDSISYRIIAVDSSQNANSSVKPEDDFYIVRIEDIQDAQNEYQNDFNQVSVDFLLTGFSITTPDGFNDGGLHSTHPYESPEQDNQTIEYLAQLKIPIILKESDSYMRFDEIVLVEPGTTGTRWGEEEFWDYVIVEGSKDEGKNWHEFEDGYDSRKYLQWFNLYNSGIDGNNSTSVGTPSNFMTSMVNLLGSSWFSGGDTVLIRFRLFSDPYANGWGWAIDNLEIQGAVSQVEENPLQNTSISVYPNPTRGIFHIQLMDLPESVHELSISVLDILGREVRSLEVETSHVLSETIDISDLPDGIYLVKFQAGKFHRLHKVLKQK
ncbi:MAG: T9SS type A sorting domain-containing protein, partial [Bacteroidota bacterium]|nr:T9SS type A sorting domain-containing protein [Bacteroidota bacterium]